MQTMSTHKHDGYSGWFEGKTHVLPVRVYYEDTDVSGLVYHANYLRYMERGRSDFLRLAGVHHMIMLKESEPLAWTLRSIRIDYLRPARLDDALEVRTRYIEMGGARLVAGQSVQKGGIELVNARVEACVITLDGRPRRIPENIRKTLVTFLEV
jgi:acyl-CoA thioester hydrolase